MAETIPGGAYRSVGADGSERWFDAEGKLLDKSAVSDARKIHRQNAAEKADAERERISLEAQRNPTAQAIAAAMAPKATKADPKAPDDQPPSGDQDSDKDA